MTPAPPTLSLETKDRQQSGDINKQPASDPSLHTFEMNHFEPISEASQQHDNSSLALVDPDAARLDPNTEIVLQSTEELVSEMRPPTTLPVEATEPARSTSPRIADAKDSTSCPSTSTPKSTVQKTPETDLRTGVVESTPEIESEEDQKAKFLHLRFQLQRGLLPIDGCPEPEKMKVMSLCLGSLEGIESPSPSALHANRIRKLLKAISKLDKIPRDSEFDIKNRAAILLEKWKASFEKGDPTTSSPMQPIDDYDIGPNAITDKQKPVDAPNPHQQLKNKTKPSTTDLAEKIPSTMVVELEQSTSDHIIEHGVAPPTDHPSLAPPTSPTLQPKPERLVIDLTGDDEVDTDTRPKPSHKPMNLPGEGPSVVHNAKRSKLPPSQNSEPFSTTVRKNQSGSKTGSAKSDIKKRKHSDGTNDASTLASASNFSKLHIAHPNEVLSLMISPAEAHPACDAPNTPRRIQRRRKTSPGTHLDTEIGWISESLKFTDKEIEKADAEIVTMSEKRKRQHKEYEAEVVTMREKIKRQCEENEAALVTMKEKRKRQREENDVEKQSVKRKKDDLIEHRVYLVGWGAQDEKVTNEWSPSK